MILDSEWNVRCRILDYRFYIVVAKACIDIDDQSNLSSRNEN